MNFELDEQQRDFAASIDAALGAADVPARGAGLGGRRHRAGPQGVGARWPTSASPRCWCPRSTTASAPTRSTWWWRCERLGRWCVPGPVTESIAVAPILLADDASAAPRWPPAS